MAPTLPGLVTQRLVLCAQWGEERAVVSIKSAEYVGHFVHAVNVHFINNILNDSMLHFSSFLWFQYAQVDI